MMHMQRSVLAVSVFLGQPDPKMCLGLGPHHQKNASHHTAGSDPSTDRT